jgi:hypothetical protein
MIIAQQFIAGNIDGNFRLSPVGTTEHARAISVVPTGLNIFTTLLPSHEWLGYSQSSLAGLQEISVLGFGLLCILVLIGLIFVLSFAFVRIP